MDVTAAVVESARVFGLTLKEKQLEAIGIHYQQAMESPFARRFWHKQQFIPRTKLNLHANVSVYIVRSPSLKTNYRSEKFQDQRD